MMTINSVTSQTGSKPKRLTNPVLPCVVGALFILTIMGNYDILHGWLRLDATDTTLSGIGSLQSVTNSADEMPHAETIIANKLLENSQTKPGKRTVFVPYPHKMLGSGEDMRCHWQTIGIHNPTLYDSTQLAAFHEGVCIPSKLNTTFRIFSSAEAVECLSPENIELVISGDSYMKQLFVGIADIIMSKQMSGGEEIIGSRERNKVISSVQKWVNLRGEKNSSFPHVSYVCEYECYPQKGPFSKTCTKCINHITSNNDRVVAVVGSGVHIHENVTWELNTFLERANRTIFVSGPSYKTAEIPEEYRSWNGRMEQLYYEMLPDVAPQKPQHPFLDVFQMTRSCFMSNCSYDGGHRSRYVNRMKAQQLLNMLCEVHYS
jgi:hypothetical protein